MMRLRHGEGIRGLDKDRGAAGAWIAGVVGISAAVVAGWLIVGGIKESYKTNKITHAIERSGFELAPKSYPVVEDDMAWVDLRIPNCSITLSGVSAYFEKVRGDVRIDRYTIPASAPHETGNNTVLTFHGSADVAVACQSLIAHLAHNTPTPTHGS